MDNWSVRVQGSFIKEIKEKVVSFVELNDNKYKEKYEFLCKMNVLIEMDEENFASE